MSSGSATRRSPKARKPTVRPLRGPLPPNAAELWGASLPSPAELAILAERRRRTARPAISQPRIEHIDTAPDSGGDTSRLGGALGSIAIMLGLVLGCLWISGLI